MSLTELELRVELWPFSSLFRAYIKLGMFGISRDRMFYMSPPVGGNMYREVLVFSESGRRWFVGGGCGLVWNPRSRAGGDPRRDLRV